MISRDKPSTEVPKFEDWTPWDENKPVEPGKFYCNDLVRVMDALLMSDRNPKISIRSLSELKELVYKCTKAKDNVIGSCVVREIQKR